jgi:hypothetical protein
MIFRIGNPVEYSDEFEQMKRLSMENGTGQREKNHLYRELSARLSRRVMEEIAALSGKKIR